MEENKTGFEDEMTPEVVETATEAAETPNEGAEGPEGECELLRARIYDLEGELREKDDRYLRLAAEYDNFRRRSREEKEALFGSALADTVGAILPIIDNLERAAAYDDGEKVREGVRMITASCEQVLAGLGVEAFGAVGDIFDPNIHNAVMHEEDDTLGEGVITEVFQKGYKKGNRIIRFAMVKTAN